MQTDKQNHLPSYHRLKTCERRRPIGGPIEVNQITNKSNRICSPSPSERLGELRMDNPLGPTWAAKSCRLTGNEGPLESKQTAYHEVRHPERQLSHWGWDQFMGNYGLFKTPIWNRFSRNLAVKSGDQWWVVTPSASSRLTSPVLLNTASVTRQPLKKTPISHLMHLLSCRCTYKRLPGNETSCTWPQPSTCP